METTPFDSQSQVFSGIRFVLLGFDPVYKSQVSQKLVNGGAVNAGQYGPNCTHVIVEKLVYDDPVCVAARRDGKILLSSLWVDHSFDVGAPVDTNSVMYRPVRDLNGIPGAKSLVICLTGYQREDREDIMTMVQLMGAQFSKPLIANRITHLICYKFEGEKYLLAKKMKRIKLINHRWLEDCLKAWKIVPEADYSKSGYELEMEAEAKDSEEELEGGTARRNERKIASQPHSLLSNQEGSKTILNTSASKLFTNPQETVSVTMNTTSGQIPSPHQTKNKHLDTENVIDVTYGTSNLCDKTVSNLSAQNKINSASTLANKSPQNEARNAISPMRTTSPTIGVKINPSTDKKIDACGMSSSLVQKVDTGTPNNGPSSPKDWQNDLFSNKRKMGFSSGSSKGKNVVCDVPISTSEIEGSDETQRPQKKYKETSLATNLNNRDVGVVENVLQPPSAVSSDIQKFNNQNMEIDKQIGNSTSKSVRRKSISKKSSAPSLSKKDTMKTSEVRNDDKKLLKDQNLEEVPQSVKSGRHIDLAVHLQIENMSWHKSLSMDDETEPPEDKDEASKEKHEVGEQENATDVVMKGKLEGDLHDVDQHNDENDPMSVKNTVLADKTDDIENQECKKTPRGNPTKKGKKTTAVKKSDHDNKKPEVGEESTPNRARRSKRNLNDLEKSTEHQVAEDVCNDPDMDTVNADMDKANADMETENVVSKKATKRNKCSLTKTNVSVKEITDIKAANKKGRQTSRRCDLEPQEGNMQIQVEDQSTGKKEVLKRGKEFPEKNLDKASTGVSKEEPMWFILAGHKFQRREFQQIIKRLKGRVCRVSHQWSYQATHFIVPDPIRRTEKFFAAAVSGRWILKPDYLSASNQAGRFLAEEPYEWHKTGLSDDGQINLEAPRKWRLLKEKSGHGAFYGMRIIIYGECIAPPLDTLKRVMKAGDGTILATSPPYTRFLNTGIDFAVVSPGMPHVDIWVQEFLKHEIPCVFADYLVEFVCKPGYPLEKHVQYGTNVWAERSSNKLMKQLEEEICEPRTPDSNDVACEVCGSRDRGEEMLICGDESGLIGCGVGTHLDCCDPPLEDVPEEDWFCVKCSSKKPKSKRSSKRKVSSSKG